MKLATYQDGSRDGQLVVVSRDLTLAHHATGIATRMQQVLDDWNFISPQLHELAQTLDHGRARHAFAFDPQLCMAPLPRACLWMEERAGQDGPADGAPRLAQRRSDDCRGPRGTIESPEPDAALEVEAGIAAIVDDVARGCSTDVGLDAVRLLALTGTARGSSTVAAFGPVVVTPDELGRAWQDGRPQLTLGRFVNGKRLGSVDVAGALRWSFGELVAALCAHGRLRAGSIVGAALANAGLSEAGRAPTLRPGDTLRFDATGRDERSLFGTIEQTLQAHLPPADGAVTATAPGSP